jgi:hypothetical protein
VLTLESDSEGPRLVLERCWWQVAVVLLYMWLAASWWFNHTLSL